MDLDSLSLKELQKLLANVTKAIDGFEDRKKKEARVELEARAKELGFSLAELLDGVPQEPKRRPAAVKYAHPENSSLTWTGRGRKPKWVVDALASGKALNDLAI